MDIWDRVIQNLGLRSNEPFPLFMTRAKRELIDSAVFFDFFVAAGAIVALSVSAVEMWWNALRSFGDLREISLRLNCLWEILSVPSMPRGNGPPIRPSSPTNGDHYYCFARKSNIHKARIIPGTEDSAENQSSSTSLTSVIIDTGCLGSQQCCQI